MKGIDGSLFRCGHLPSGETGSRLKRLEEQGDFACAPRAPINQDARSRWSPLYTNLQERVANRRFEMRPRLDLFLRLLHDAVTKGMLRCLCVCSYEIPHRGSKKKKKRRRVAFCSLPIFEGDRLWCCFCVSCFLKPCGTCAGKLWRGNSALWNPDIQTSHWLYDMSFFFKCPTPLEALCCCWHCNDDRCCLAFAVCMAKGGLAVMGMSQLCPCGVLRYFFRGICQVWCKKCG